MGDIKASRPPDRKCFNHRFLLCLVLSAGEECLQQLLRGVTGNRPDVASRLRSASRDTQRRTHQGRTGLALEGGVAPQRSEPDVQLLSLFTPLFQRIPGQRDRSTDSQGAGRVTRPARRLRLHNAAFLIAQCQQVEQRQSLWAMWHSWRCPRRQGATSCPECED